MEDVIVLETESLGRKIEQTQVLEDRVNAVNPHDNPLEFIRICMELERELEEKESTSTLQIFKKVGCNKEIVEIPENAVNSLYQQIDSLSLNEMQEAVSGLIK